MTFSNSPRLARVNVPNANPSIQRTSSDLFAVPGESDAVDEGAILTEEAHLSRVHIPYLETVFRFGACNRQMVTARRVSNYWRATIAFSKLDHLPRLKLPDVDERT